LASPRVVLYVLSAPVPAGAGWLVFPPDRVTALFAAGDYALVRLFIGRGRFGFHLSDLSRFFFLDNLVGLNVVARHPLDLLGSRDRLQAEAHTLPVTVDANDAQQVILPFAQHLARVADARPRNLRGVQQPLDARLDLYEGAIIDDADDASFDKLADLVALFHRAPRVGQQLFPAEADALALAVHLENVDLDLLAHAHDLFGMVHALPGQLG